MNPFGERGASDIKGFIQQSPLGIKFTAVDKQPTVVIDGERRLGNPATRFSFMIYDDTPVFRLARKRARQVSRAGRRTTETERRRIVAVEPVESVCLCAAFRWTVPTGFIWPDAP